jgi:hypothetical protein
MILNLIIQPAMLAGYQVMFIIFVNIIMVAITFQMTTLMYSIKMKCFMCEKGITFSRKYSIKKTKLKSVLSGFWNIWERKFKYANS